MARQRSKERASQPVGSRFGARLWWVGGLVLAVTGAFLAHLVRESPQTHQRSVTPSAASIERTGRIGTSPRGLLIPRSLARNQGTVDTPSSWPIMYDRNHGPDLSFLNRAHGRAGSHGRVVRRGEKLYFEDGTPAKFWGTNITAWALFAGSDKSIRQEAARLSRLGYNLVRLHHHDSAWVKPNIFKPGRTTRELNEESFRKIGVWVSALANQGIYVWLDLFVGRKFQPHDEIAAYDELPDGHPRGFFYVNPDLEARSLEFATQYLGRKNPVTQMTLAEDPAILAILVMNEGDLTGHFGSVLLPESGNTRHQEMFRSAARPFIMESGFAEEEVLVSWQPGPPKVLLAELEYRYFERTVQHLRKDGFAGLIAAGSTWGRNSLYGLPSLTSGQLIDVHSYGEGAALQQDPLVAANFIHWIAAAQLPGFPLTVSEWNIPPPAEDRFTGSTYVASIGALQGWDAILQYAYQQYSTSEARLEQNLWSSADDPARSVQQPAAALMFRRGDVARAEHTFRLRINAADFYGEKWNPNTSVALRTLAEQSRLLVEIPDRPELKWDDDLDRMAETEKGEQDKGQRTTVVGPHDSFLPEGTHWVSSDTGEITRDFRAGVHWFDTERSQGAAGALGSVKVELSQVSIECDNPSAAISVVSMDGQPLSNSGKILISAVSRAVAWEKLLPYRSQPLLGEIRIRSSQDFCARAIGPNPSPPLRLAATNGIATLRFSREDFSHWYELRRVSASHDCSTAQR